MADTGRPVAIVTGASSGIGASYARRLAEKGYDLVIVARRRDRLQYLAREVQTRWGATADVIPGRPLRDGNDRRGYRARPSERSRHAGQQRWICRLSPIH